ncbi:flagellar M-ring protein FliF [Duganella sp. CF458]|uniref:flagellar basal-body MS-ring/collar protein FliF n=1 Tax=Duganella sp. CF458 TaxID=1884368 RepID=UPI0008EF9FC2|nr:flagellar basal-body MS-ring/collar protein FliF [Duganella sp. CF458]SFG88668.1 flagellar M-ring protein FliF [Duganella sp. CF458]
MNALKDNWRSLGAGARTGVLAGMLLIVLLVGSLAWWVYRTDYQVLFADLAPADAAAMTAELDKLKTPYQLGGEGRTILVPHDMVYKTRLKLMGKELPLRGSVGFEVFNNADFGMTDFVQKVNYQRAVQGELQRTILAIDDIQSARVHLAVPEQGLFKRSATRAKASVTLGMKEGRRLGEEQVAGIQRLVAASVADLTVADVTVLDQHGVALTRVAGGDAAEAAASGQLDAKRGNEDYLLKKVNRVLEQTFGPGAAVASIDLALNMDQSKVTMEQVLPGQGANAGLMVRERRVSSEGEGGQNGAAKAPGTNTTEADYQVGRRVEQLNVASGGVRRMTVAVLVRQSLNEDQVEKLKEVVALAVGLNRERGDALVLYSMQQFGSLPDSLPTPVAASALPAAAGAPADAAPRAAQAAGMPVKWVLAALAAGVLLVGAVLLAGRRRSAAGAPAQLDAAARERLLLDIRHWIDTPAATSVERQ